MSAVRQAVLIRRPEGGDVKILKNRLGSAPVVVHMNMLGRIIQQIENHYNHYENCN